MTSDAATIDPPRRRGRPAGVKAPKHPPRAVGEIWHAAGEEERSEAVRKGQEILAYWRGLTGSRAVATALGVRQNRVYLLQRKALAGMVAGLLPSPKKGEEAKATGRDPVKELAEAKKEVAALRKERERLLGLIRLLRGLPVAKEGKDGHPERAGSGAKMARPGAAKQTGARSGGENLRSDREDATKLGEKTRA
ncbi:MAG: hypothetical protein AAB578_02495 [Elusimicrobiota bacterium]